MLNFEAVDIEKNMLKIIFTEDQDGTEITIMLPKKQALDLGKELVNKASKKERM